MQIVSDILIIDDDAATVEFLIEALTDEGYTVRSALDGKSALTQINCSRPALVFLDLHLNGMAGTVELERLQRNGSSEVPVVIMTADSQPRSDSQRTASAYACSNPSILMPYSTALPKIFLLPGYHENNAPPFIIPASSNTSLCLAARQKATTPGYRQVRHEHWAIERKLAEVVRQHDGRRARYRGRARNRIQYLLTGLVINVKRMVRLLLGSPPLQERCAMV